MKLLNNKGERVTSGHHSSSNKAFLACNQLHRIKLLVKGTPWESPTTQANSGAVGFFT